MRYVILCGGERIDSGKIAPQISPSDYVLCADEGAVHARAMGIFPQMIIGDMDSIDPATLAWAKAGGVPTEVFPVEKDMTDSELCLSRVPEKEPILLVMPLSGRFDHVISNIMIAARYALEGRTIVVTDGRTRIWPLAGPATLKLDVSDHKKILGTKDLILSLVPVFGSAEKIRATGMYYPLDGITIDPGRSLGVSNRPDHGASSVEISFERGVLLVVVSPEGESNDL
ncbi:MAG: thiamine diphosphokinase [Oscillospiraceae bacterium]|nr:thiamine diphosphokinase [Oscillospiraceae bacterium]